MKERRLHQRSPVTLDAAYNLPEDSDSIYYITIINISVGGFCFIANEDLRRDTPVRLVIDIDEAEKIHVNVKVAWCKKSEEDGKYKVGVAISDASGAEFDKFLNLYTEEVAKLFEEIN